MGAQFGKPHQLKPLMCGSNMFSLQRCWRRNRRSWKTKQICLTNRVKPLRKSPKMHFSLSQICPHCTENSLQLPNHANSRPLSHRYRVRCGWLHSYILLGHLYAWVLPSIDFKMFHDPLKMFPLCLFICYVSMQYFLWCCGCFALQGSKRFHFVPSLILLLSAFVVPDELYFAILRPDIFTVKFLFFA